jgi:intergrase/recombinase
MKHHDCLANPQKLNEIPASNRGNILKTMVNLAKFLGIYETYKAKLKQHGIKWVSTDNSFTSFLRIVNNNHSNLGEWYKAAQIILRPNERLYLKFTLLSGLRKEESANSLTLIQKLATENQLSEYWNAELGILEHFKYGELFLRNTKNCYISIVARALISEVANSQPVSYYAIRKRLTSNKLTLRIKELRSYFATYLRKNGIISEYIDLIQGRIPRSVFARHYLKVDDFKELVSQVLAVTENLESSLLS